MATLKLIQFSGEIPRLIPRLLPETAAQRAENVRLDNGGLTPFRQAKLAHTVTGLTVGNIKTIYRHLTDWLAWSTVVNAVPGPVAQDRLYYTGDSAPKMRVSGTVYDLAVPFPTVVLTGTPAGAGTGPVISRLYAYTFVTSFGEESEPNPISAIVNWQAGQTVTLAGFQAAPAGRGITLQRIYRSQSSVASGTDLFLIAERAVSAGNYVDAIAVDDFAEVLPSRDWNAPPAGLSGLTAGANGMMFAFVGKDLYISEPFRPHAWPEKYVLTMDYNIVALGSYGTTIVVMTDGLPYIVQGTAPENMQQEKIEKNLPCINARGVVDLGYGVVYPSHDGLVMVSAGSVNVVTEALMTRNDWLRTSPATFVAGQYNGRYFASYEYLGANDEPVRGTFILDLTGATPFLLRGSRYAEACFYDIQGSALYMLSGTGIYEWDALGQVSETMTWKSKRFVLPAPACYSCILIEGSDSMTEEEQEALEDSLAAVLAQNAILFAAPSIGGEINGAAMGVYQVNGDNLGRGGQSTYAAVRVYADGVYVTTISNLNSVERLPAVDKARAWEVEVTGTKEITQISMATSVRELNQF